MWEVEKGKIGLFPSLDAKRIHMLLEIKKKKKKGPLVKGYARF